MSESVYTGTVWYLDKREVHRLWAISKDDFKMKVISKVNNKRMNDFESICLMEDFSFGPISRKG